ncbi:phospholipase D/nuclease [Trichocladium antarcticum]|uniref:Phospholipase D/nuclease n=1 Tax=Trichocladium antarcticum TaxID=1450529 RepID=A0AAN6Z9U5_9PEZI|nr:phospholipase D/nuclease [Trichocladium antarcticum]
MDQPGKRPAPFNGDETGPDPTVLSLTHPISPPTKKRRLAEPMKDREEKPEGQSPVPSRKFRSPFQLTRIRDLPPELNKDTVTLKDILGDPLISECWEFNYLHDIDFLMAAFDEDVRHLVKVHVVHGFWKKEDPNKLQLQDAASRYPNVVLHAAYLPEMFGTHHSKMMILLRHDETAQIVIHTANMIVRDWTNMTQAAWVSPRLPLMKPSQPRSSQEAKIGSGAKFKIDFLNYLRACDTRRPTYKSIISKLTKHDFSAIKGSLIASVPGRHKFTEDSPTRWGWAAMEQALEAVPVHQQKARIAVQISSIATLGPTDNWLRNTLFRALSGGQNTTNPPQPPDFKVIFPTADEIRKSLDGYHSGGSIHTKIQSPQQAKQLQYLEPLFCHWANDSAHGAELPQSPTIQQGEGGRKRAAPHIKTYIRYHGGDRPGHQSIDWALTTSANLSKQAWGEAPNAAGETRIASYEIGVLVWPALYAEGATMQATFLTDALEEEGGEVVALRVPYNLPLQPYGEDEIPWVATARHAEPDWMGGVWGVE